MNERAKDTVRADPVIDRSGGITGAGRLIILAFGLVGIAIGFALVEREQAEPFVLGLLGILAVIGVVSLVRRRDRAASALAPAASASTSPAIFSIR